MATRGDGEQPASRDAASRQASGDRGESTQPLSTSQIVEVSAKPPPRGGDANDQSVAWKGMVVGADEFAPAPARRSRVKWAIVGVLGAGAIGAGAYALTRSSDDAPPPAGERAAPAAPEPAPVRAPIASDAAPSAPAPSAPPPIDASATAPATAPIDAGVAPADAAPPRPAPAKKHAIVKKKKPHK